MDESGERSERSTYLESLSVLYKKGDLEAARALLAQLQADVAEGGNTLLSIAVEENDVDGAEAVVAMGGEAELSKPRRYSYPALSFACARGNAKMIRCLLSLGATAGPAAEQDKTTPLVLLGEVQTRKGSQCAAEEFPEIAALLVAAGASVNEKDHNQLTPLHAAAHSSNLVLIQWLVDHGADINAVSTFGYTPLSEAAGEGNTEAVQLLLKLGASADNNHEDFSSVSEMADYHGFAEVAEILKK